MDGNDNHIDTDLDPKPTFGQQANTYASKGMAFITGDGSGPDVTGILPSVTKPLVKASQGFAASMGRENLDKAAATSAAILFGNGSIPETAMWAGLLIGLEKIPGVAKILHGQLGTMLEEGLVADGAIKGIKMIGDKVAGAGGNGIGGTALRGVLTAVLGMAGLKGADMLATGFGQQPAHAPGTP